MFDISVKHSQWYGKLYVPDQNVYGFVMSSTTATKKDIRIVSDELGLEFNGRRKDSSLIRGTFLQNGQELELDLKRVRGEWPERKPQTPVSPFSYFSEKVKFPAAGGRISIAGTLTLPDTLKRHPVIILISGSGAQDRNGSIGNHKPFWVIADYFTKNGFAVLRCDDRGAGETRGHQQTMVNTTTEDLAKDVIDMVLYLKGRAHIDTNDIILIGHSEGGAIAPMAASKIKDIGRMVLLAAPAISGLEINVYQNTYGLKTAGWKDRDIRAFEKIHRTLLSLTLKYSDTTRWKMALDSALRIWEKSGATSKTRKLIYGGKTRNLQFVYDTYRAFRNPWWQYFLSYDPLPALLNSNIPTLMLYGSRDIQVPAGENSKVIQNAFAGRSSLPEIQIFEGMNHLFQNCSTCTVQEYFDLKESFSDQVLNAMLQWLK